MLMVAILGVYQYYMGRNRPPAAPEPKQQESPAPAPPEREAPPELTPETLSRLTLSPPLTQEEEILVETNLLRVVFSTRGGRIKSWQLKKYLEPDGRPVEMAGKPGPAGDSLDLCTWSRHRGTSLPVYRANTQRLLLSESERQGTLTLVCVTSGGLELTKSLTFFEDDYKVDLETKVRNLGHQAQSLTFDLLWGPGIRSHEGKEEKTLKPATSLVNGQIVQDKWEKVDKAVEHRGDVSWTAIQDNYFCAALIPLGKGSWAQIEKMKGGGPLVGLVFPAKRLLPAEGASESFSLYVGPKEIDRLTKLGFGLRDMIDLGWFGFLARPALYCLKYINGFIKNYGLAIIILTFLVRIVLFPLTHKSLKSMQEMQRLQPKINMLRERFKDDSKRMNQELMELYRKHNINPMGGCLPMLVQIPIFIALYNALINSVELWRAPFILWVKDLSAKDPYYVLPILMGASWLVQQWMTPTTGDPRQAKMMLLMPVIFTFMFLNFPSGLVLYFLVSNLLGIAQQYFLNQYLKVPSKAGGSG
jgi:YidC/Oxa1 family membrane protein insertase